MKLFSKQSFQKLKKAHLSKKWSNSVRYVKTDEKNPVPVPKQLLKKNWEINEALFNTKLLKPNNG